MVRYKKPHLTPQQRFRRGVIATAAVTTLGFQLHDAYEKYQEELQRNHAERVAAEQKADQKQQDLAALHESCGISSVWTKERNRKFLDVKVADVGNVDASGIRLDNAEQMPRDHVYLKLIFNLGGKGVRAYNTPTNPRVDAQVLITAHPVLKTNDGSPAYGDAVPVYSGYYPKIDRDATQSMSTETEVSVLPPSNEHKDVPLAIRVNTIAEPVNSAHAIDRSIGSVMCGYLTYRDGMWWPISVDGEGAPDLQPVTFTNIEID